MSEDDWLDRLYLAGRVVHIVHPTDQVRELLRRRRENEAASLHPLDRLILRETCLEILDALTPEERAVAVLRLEGLDDNQIGQILGIDNSSVCKRMARAQQRLIEQLPDAAHLLDGRQLERGVRPPEGPPLERGWICDWRDHDDWPDDDDDWLDEDDWPETAHHEDSP